MQISFRLGTYIATNVTDGALMKSHGWSAFKDGSYRTSQVTTAAPFFGYATGALQDKLRSRFEAVEREIQGSMALSSDFHVPLPKGEVARPYQRAGVEFLHDKTHGLLADSMRLGKPQPTDCSVLTPSGWRNIGELAVGDHVIRCDGARGRVTGVFPKGVKPIYRIRCFDGSETRACGEHLFTYKTCRGGWHTKSVEDMQRAGLTYPNSSTAYKYVLPTMACADFDARPVDIPPYILGVLIGDGYLSGSSVTFSAGDNKQQIKERVAALLPDGMSLSGPRAGACPQWNIISAQHKFNPLRRALTSYGLCVGSKEKKIPDDYLFNTKEVRLELLRGLMDTDGSANKNRVVFHTCSQQLAKDVTHLVRSLGGISTVREYDRSTESRPIEYQVRVTLDVCPFYLDYKGAQWAPSRKKRGKAIVSIESAGSAECVCISVDADDHLYVTDDFIVTHNTLQAIGVGNVRNIKTSLTIPPATAKVNWQRAQMRFKTYGGEVGIVNGDDWPNTPHVICNYDILERHEERIADTEFDLCNFDEAHKLRNFRAQRTRFCLGDGRKEPGIIRAKQMLFITGTPIFTRPRDLWPIVRACDPHGLGKKEKDFLIRYCGAVLDERGVVVEADGATNLLELQRIMRQRFMVRRDKKDVAGDAVVQRETVVIPNDEYRELVRAEREANAGASSTVNNLFAAAQNGDDLSQLFADLARSNFHEAVDEGMLSTIRKELALLKVPTTVSLVEEILENPGEKVVIFAHHRDVVAKLKQSFPDAAVLVGGMTPKQKDAAEQRFQNDPNCRVFIGNIEAAGQAIRLDAADHLVFCEISWSPGDMEQCEDRIWDVLKERLLFIYRIVVEGTLDEQMSYVVDKRIKDNKQAMTYRGAE